MANQPQRRQSRELVPAEQVREAIENIEAQVKPLARAFGRMNRNKEEIQFGRELLHLTEIVRKSEGSLIACTPDSFREAILNIAAVGLSLNPVSHHVYLVPRKNKHTGNKEATVIVGYRGLIHSATRSGAVLRVSADCVYSNDKFRIIKGSNPGVAHEICTRGIRGKFLGAYCYYTLPSGLSDVEWIDDEQMEAIQKCAETQKIWGGPFKDEQRKKAVIRRASKRWGSNEYLEAIEEVMQKNEPYDFEKVTPKPEDESQDNEQPVVLSDKDILILDAMIDEYGITDQAAKEKWLKRLAQANNFDEIAQVPLRQFESLKSQLAEGLKAWKQKQDDTR